MSVFFAMSGSLAAIFSLLGSKKWIIREGVNGPRAPGLRTDGEGFPEVAGVSHGTLLVVTRTG